MTEALQYYDKAFDPLFEHIRKQGVNILDYDPFEQAPPFVEKFDFVSVMAVLEHYPHSLRQFMANASALAKKNGSIYLEVPNVAYLPKRVTFFLLGATPYTPVRQIYNSAVPFIGHHHEFTMAELKDVAELSGLKVTKEYFYNYWRGDYSAIGNVLRRPHEWLIFTLWKSARECLAVVCKRS
jgi:2-polyprenyl-3-methyl-5-hydroxy-6-metoxy-1,4-benzoquinol methylase